MALAKPAWPVLQRGNPLAQGLVAAWPFFEVNSQSLNDIGPNHYNGAASGPGLAQQWVGSPFGSAINFPNSTAYYYSTNIPWTTGNPGKPISIATWVNTPGGTTGAIIGNNTTASLTGSRINLHLPWSDNNIYWDYDNSGGGRISTSFSAYLNTWAFVVVTNDGIGDKAIYVNGHLLASNTNANGAGTDSVIINTIGQSNAAGQWPYNGSVADLKLYNRALSAAEVAQLYADPFAIYRKPSRRWEVVIAAGGNTSFSFPNKGWVWNPQAETLTFNNASTHKQWVWNPQAPTDKFNIAASQKGWVWQANAPAISTLIITAAQTAWHWTGNAPAINTAIAAAQKAWHWTANAALTTLNLTGVQKALNWLGNAPLVPSAIAALRRALPWSANPPKLTGGDLPSSQSLHIPGGLPSRKKRSQPPE